ncbi:unnamed protein product [Prunus brigantina]
MKPHITKCKLPQSVTGLALNFFQAVSRKEIKQEPAAGATEFKRLLHLLHIFFFCMESHITHGWSFPSPSHFIADMLYNSSYRHRVSDYFFQHSKRNTTWCYELLGTLVQFFLIPSSSCATSLLGLGIETGRLRKLDE